MGVVMESNGINSHRKLPKKKRIIENEKTDRHLKEVRIALDRGVKMGQLMFLLLQWIEIQEEHKLNLDEIADGLNELMLPTISGIGKWRADTIAYITFDRSAKPF